MSAVELLILAVLATASPEKTDFCHRPGALCSDEKIERQQEPNDATRQALDPSLVGQTIVATKG